MDLVGDLLSKLTGFGRDPTSDIVAAAAQPAATDGQQAPAATTIPGTPGTPSPVPAAPQGGVPAAAPPPPDLGTLYQKLMDRDRQNRMMDSGMTLMAAGLASPENRAALVSQAGSAGSSGGTVGSQLQTLMAMQKNQQDLAAKALMRAQLPAIAKKYGITPEAANVLLEQGKMADFISQSEKPDGTEVRTDPATGKQFLINKRTGETIQQFDTGLAPAGTEIIDDPATGKKTMVTKDTGNTVKQFDTGLAPNKQVVTNDGTGEKSVVDLNNPNNKQSLGGSVAPSDKVKNLNYAHDHWKELGYPDPADPANSAAWAKISTGILSNGGVTINNGAENAEEGAVGKANGDIRGERIKAGGLADAKIQQLDIIGDALQRGGDNVITGPFATHALGAKQTLQSLFGIDLGGIPETEVASKAGFGLATQAVKAITSRPTQMEFAKALENNPGILLSPKGSMMMIDILKQQEQAAKDLAAIAQTTKGADLQAKETEYYRQHPIMSPFDHSKPLGQRDLDELGVKPSGPNMSAVPDGAVQRLRSNPAESDKFDAIFGKGAASKVLGK